MVPIPPPPLPPRMAPWAPPSADAMALDDPTATGKPQRPGQLTSRWAGAFVAGWALISITLITVGGGSDRLGKPTWWLDHPVLVVAPFVLPVLSLVLGIRNAPTAVPIGWLATGSLIATAALDRSSAPGAAAIEAALAIAGFLVTTSAIAGRIPRPPK